MYFVYVISSIKKNYWYIGISDNPERRINQHNKGYNKTTKPYAPFDVKLIQSCENRTEARKKEIFFKSGSGREYLKKILPG